MKHEEVEWKTVRFICDIAKILKPKEDLKISEWADRNMVLPEGSNEAGRYSSDTILYQKDIMDAIIDPETVEVTVMSSAQVGKTTIIMCGIGYYIDHEPATQMLVMPTIALGEKFSKTRLAKMITDVPVLSAKVSKAKSRDSNNTILLKSYPGGDIAIAGANSPSSLSSDPRRIIWMDEVDRFPESAGAEGNPVELAEARSTSFWNEKHIKTSTPTIKGHSKIEDAYNDGSMEEWSVKCPECGEFQPYRFGDMDFDTLSMACRGCGCIIPEQKWKESEHKWIARHPERRRFRSFHLNQMANPFVDWEKIVRQFKKANEKYKKYHDKEDLKVFVNTVLGETWEEADYLESGADARSVSERAEHYGAELPDGVLLLTAAVDVQDNRFEVEVRGWARDYETWGIYKTEIYGNLITDAPWDELEAYLDQTFQFADGRGLGIAITVIDSGGHFPNKVYKWTKKMKQAGMKCHAIKGFAAKPDIPLLYRRTVVDIRETVGKKDVVVDRTVLQVLGVDSGKEDISNRLTITDPGPGYCHFPLEGGRGYDGRYYQGLFSEYKTMKKVNGIWKTCWIKKDGVRNEPFDLLNYNYAASEMLRPDWDVLEKKLAQGIDYTKKGKKMESEHKKWKKPRNMQGLEVF